MNIQENKLSESEIELLIELERSEIEPDLRDAAQKISQNIDIPGFRKGAAPYDMVCRHIGGEAKIYEEALQKAVGSALVRAIQERKIQSVGQPQIDVQKMVPPFGISFKAKISLAPKVELGDPSKIKIEKRRPKIEDSDVDNVIDNLRQMRAKESDVTREARKGDKVILDFEIFRDGAAIENGKANDYPLVLGEGKFIPGFEEQIIGLEPSAQKTFELKFPDQYHEKSLAGKPAEFRVKVKQVQERQLPEFNDEFAKNLGGYKSAKELREKVAENLRHEKEKEEKERFEMSAMQELVKLSTIGQLPESLIKEESNRMIRELENDVLQQGVKFDDYLQSIKKTKEELKNDFKPKAEDRIKMMLVAREFGKQQNVKVDEKDIQKEIEISKKTYAQNPEMLAKAESEDFRQYIANALTSRAIFEKLVEIAG